MHSITQSDSLALAREIVHTDDAATLERAKRVLSMDDDSLIELRGAVQDVLKREREAFADRIREDVLLDQIAGAVLLRRIVERGAQAIAHDTYTCAIRAPKMLDKRIDVLRRLEGLVPESELRMALFITSPQPEWKADATKLRALARKYGGRVREIVEEGIVETFGQPLLVFDRKEDVTNVTPARTEIAS